MFGSLVTMGAKIKTFLYRLLNLAVWLVLLLVKSVLSILAYLVLIVVIAQVMEIARRERAWERASEIRQFYDDVYEEAAPSRWSLWGIFDFLRDDTYAPVHDGEGCWPDEHRSARNPTYARDCDHRMSSCRRNYSNCRIH